MKTIMVVVFLAMAAPVRADISVKNYHDTRAQGGEVWRGLTGYLQGVANGYIFANAFTESRFHRSFVCVPINLNVDNITDIIDDQLKAEDAKQDDVVEVSLLLGMRKTFPCKN